MTAAQVVQKTLVEYHKVTDCTISIQDGPLAGQTIPHVHVHVVPRRPRDFKDDDIYKELEHKGKNQQPRSKKEMSDEAEIYRNVLY